MGQQNPITIKKTIAGQEILLETGKLAALTDGSVMLRFGNMMLLAAVVSAEEAREDQGFFPLTVEYREKFASNGRIPGNFFKREARPSDYEVLICRLIDRAVRPLFPDNYKNETQIFVYLISADEEVLPDAYAAFAASAAFMCSNIPFEGGPISEVRVGRINGQFIVNPSRTQMLSADMDFIVAGSMDNIVMVEGEADECAEADLIEAIKVAHEAIKEQCAMQLELRKMVGITENRPVAVVEVNEELHKFVYEQVVSKIYALASSGTSKHERRSQLRLFKEELEVAALAKFGEEYMAENAKKLSSYFDDAKYDTVRDVVLTDQIRLDGRKPNEIRNIWAEVDYLPSTHGSALFTRGETQSLTTITLGSKLDDMLIDNALEHYYDKFYLHYNFPSFCTNEVGRPRGVSRREIGHGNLARRSLQRMMPKDYPYTVRIVSDILESNGSSSMATVCAGSLALMDAGVTIKKAVSGIAMGLIADNKGRSVVLSDILGDEDHLGDMDFKVTGTADGICAVQMDIKVEGLDYALLNRALNQAREGRLHILGEMNKVLAHPNDDLKPHAPRIELIIVEAKFIGAIIGSGGKVIQGLQAETKTVITVEEKEGKGYVHVSGAQTGVDQAMAVIKGIITEPEIGDEFDAKVVKLMPFGAFVEFLPGKDGLLHVSEISYERVENVEDVLKEGQSIQVKIIGIDPKNGKFKLSHKALLPKPEGYVERERSNDNRDNRSGGGGNRNNNNRGGGGGYNKR